MDTVKKKKIPQSSDLAILYSFDVESQALSTHDKEILNRLDRIIAL